MAERHGRILARLSELGLAHAERLHERAMAAEDPKSAAELGLTFHRVSRSIRQSIALEARLVRDAARAEREAHTARDELQTVRERRRVDQRKDEIRAGVRQAIWDEIDPGEDERADDLVDLMEERLELYGRLDGFGLEPLEAQLARFYADLDLKGPDPEGDPESEALKLDPAPPDTG